MLSVVILVGNFVTFYKPYPDEKLEVRLCPIETKQSFKMCFYMLKNRILLRKVENHEAELKRPKFQKVK